MLVVPQVVEDMLKSDYSRIEINFAGGIEEENLRVKIRL